MMNKQIDSIFNEQEIIEKIREKLPYLFQLAEIDNSRDGKLGMEIGSARERIIIALLIYKFGEENIKTDTGKQISGVKLIWTVDAQKALEFAEKYSPKCDLLLVQINWNETGYLYYIPKEVQTEVLKKIGRENYLKLPKPGTNPRGVELNRSAIPDLTQHPETRKIEIKWTREEIGYNPYHRWVDHWKD